jgi:hypothetical protein
MTSRVKTISATFAIAGCVLTALAPAVVAKTQSGSFVPGLSIVPNVYQPDGHTLRTYQTAAGQTLWSPDLPVKHGDKLQLKIFATTGGAELDKLIVRLDNVKIAELSAAPWDTTLDTSSLQQGSHMVEVWAEATGAPAKSTTKTFSFVVADDQQPTTTVGSAVVEPDSAAGAASAAGPALPEFLANRQVDEGAGVSLRSQDADTDRLLTTDDGSILVSAPTLLYCERASGSQAVKYAYAVTRGDKTIVTSTKPESLENVKIRLQRLDESKAGLLPGKVTLWVWGIDQSGHPSTPLHRDFVIASPDNK